MKSIIILLVLVATFVTAVDLSSVQGCAPVGDDCSACGYGYLMCSGINQHMCYNPEIGQSCCADGCICPSGAQCPSVGIECVSTSLPTISLTSTFSRTVTVTSLVGGPTETLTLLPADSSSSITSILTTSLFTTKNGLSPCQYSLSEAETYSPISQLTNLSLIPDSSQSYLATSTSTLSAKPSGQDNTSSRSSNSTVIRYSTVSLSNSGTKTPVTVPSKTADHNGSSTIQKSFPSTTTATASYTGSSLNISSNITPVNSFAWVVAMFWVSLF